MGNVTIARYLLMAALSPWALTAWQQVTGRAVLSPRMVTPLQVADLEQAVAANPGDLPALGRLLQAYSDVASQNRDDYRAARLRHIQFLVEAYPGSTLASASISYVGKAGTPYANAADHENVRALWVSEANQHFDDKTISLNALRFLEVEEKPDAEDLFKRLIAAKPTEVDVAAGLGFFYAAGLVEADTMDGRVIAGLPDVDRTGWSEHCRAALGASNNPHVLMGAATALPNVSMRRTGGGSGYEAMVQYSEELRRRAVAVDPALSGSKTMPAEFQLFADESKRSDGQSAGPTPQAAPPMATISGTATPNQVRVGSSVQAGNLILGPPPVYPQGAVDGKVQGTVRLQVSIGEDGLVNKVQLISGHPMLVQAAQDAVKTWKYRPTILNGAAVSVSTTVDVTFTLPPE